MEKKIVPAAMEYMDEVMEYIESFLRAENCSQEECYEVQVSVEELFTNIASYSYGTEGGWAEVLCKAESGELVIQLRDQGRPYNPWARKDPDFQIPFDERPIGGLGIYMVKKFMDQVEYRYEDGCNITTMTKCVGGNRDGKTL